MIRPNKFGYGVPILSYKVENRTPLAWTTLALQLQLKWQCAGETQTASRTVIGTLGQNDNTSEPFVQNYEELVISLAGRVDGCSGEVVDARLVLAENQKYSIDGRTGLRRNFAKEAATEAAARHKRETDATARAAREAQRVGAERATIRVRCGVICKATIHKRVVDLTVEESKQIHACERPGVGSQNQTGYLGLTGRGKLRGGSPTDSFPADGVQRQSGTAFARQPLDGLYVGCVRPA